MDQRKLAFIITHIILRIRDYPSPAIDELLSALDDIDRKYDLAEKLSPQEWDAVVESRDDVARIDTGSLDFSKTSLRPEDIDTMGKKHLEEAVARLRMRSGEQQGDVADLIFALLDEYLL